MTMLGSRGSSSEKDSEVVGAAEATSVANEEATSSDEETDDLPF